MNDKNMNEFLLSKLHLKWNQHFHLSAINATVKMPHGFLSVCFHSYIHWSSHSSAKVFLSVCWACSLSGGANERCWSWGKSAHSRTEAHLYSHSRMIRACPLFDCKSVTYHNEPRTFSLRGAVPILIFRIKKKLKYSIKLKLHCKI